MPNIGKLFFRLRLGPFQVETRRLKQPSKDNYKVRQVFFIPITNRFDVLTLEIVSYVTTGLFQGQHKESIIKEYSIPIPVLKQREKLPLSLAINPKEDFKKVKQSDKEKLTEGVMNFFGINDKKA